MLKTNNEFQKKKQQFIKFNQLKKQNYLVIQKMIQDVNKKKKMKIMKINDIKNKNANKKVNDENILNILSNTKNKKVNQVLPKISIVKPTLNDIKNQQNIKIPRRILEMQQKQRESDEKMKKKYLDIAQNDREKMMRVHLKYVRELDEEINKNTNQRMNYVRQFNCAGKKVEILLNNNKNLLKVFIDNIPVIRITNNKIKSDLKKHFTDMPFKKFEEFYRIFNKELSNIERDRENILNRINNLNNEKHILNQKFEHNIVLPYLNNVSNGVQNLPLANNETIVSDVDIRFIQKLRRAMQKVYYDKRIIWEKKQQEANACAEKEGGYWDDFYKKNPVKIQNIQNSYDKDKNINLNHLVGNKISI